MPIWISQIAVNGIRGFNSETTLTLGPDVNLLQGNNGLGKTSLLQSIEWCLTGKMQYLEGDEFSKEDAFVNLFTPSAKGKVELQLSTPKGPVTVSRTRKMGKSTTRGSSPLSVKIGNKLFEDDDAESELQKVLGVPIDEISSSIYLHQDAPRAVLSLDAKERSRSIGRMLGIDEIRSFLEALTTRRNLTKTIKELNESIERQKRDKVQFAVKMQERVDSGRKALLDNGYSEEDLRITTQSRNASEILKHLRSLASRLDFQATFPNEPTPDVTSVKSFLRQADESIQTIERQRTKSLQIVYQNVEHIAALKTQLISSRDEAEKLGGSVEGQLQEKMKSLEAESDETETTLVDLTTRSANLANEITALDRTKDRLGTARSTLNDLEARIRQIEQTNGTEEAILKDGEELDGESSAINHEIETLGTLERLLDSALDYISGERPDKCPVCEQPILTQNVIGRIKDRTQSPISEHVRSLKQRAKDLRSKKQALMQIVEDLHRLRKEVQDQKIHESQLRDSFERETDMTLGEDIVAQIKSREEQLKTAEDSVSEAKRRENQISIDLAHVKGEISRLATVRGRYASLTKEVQQELGVKGEPERLLEDIDHRIAELRTEEKELAETGDIDSLRRELQTLKGATEFCETEAELERIQRDVPNATAIIKQLEGKVAALRELEGSLGAIEDVVTEYEAAAAKEMITSLENSFNKYFESLSPHSHFTKVRVEVEEEQPPVYSIRAVGESKVTYITTRFSNAQMNAAAIALFLARNQRLAGNLGTILLDDPTQSMDTAHKKAVCNSVTQDLKGRQVILATEDHEIGEMLEASGPKLKRVEFEDWSPKGPVLAKAR